MIHAEKTENAKTEEVPEEINSHVSFLTDELKKSLGGKNAIFEKDELNKKPGASYSFEELC